MRSRAIQLVSALAALSVVSMAPAASAHVEPEVSVVPADSTSTVAFTVEHGCDGSPTVEVAFQAPEGAGDPQPVEKAGWTGSVSDDVVTYAGGSLSDDQEDTFAVRFTAPDEVGTVLRFPFIQTCEEGTVDWIQESADAERPAPVVEVGQPDPDAPTTTVAPSTTAVPTTTAPPAPTGATSSTAADDATTTTTTTLPEGALVANDGDDGGGGSGLGDALPWIIGVTILAVAGGAYLALRGRQATEADRPDAGAAS